MSERGGGAYRELEQEAIEKSIKDFIIRKEQEAQHNTANKFDLQSNSVITDSNIGAVKMENNQPIEVSNTDLTTE